MTARFPVSGEDGAHHARTAFESYRRAFAGASASTEALLRSLIIDLGHFAAMEMLWGERRGDCIRRSLSRTQ